MMKICLFVDWYPNPYKTYFDSQFVTLLKMGHEIKIFSEGAYRSTINDDVIEYGLEAKTTFYPSTLSSTPGFLPNLIKFGLRHPVVLLRRISSILLTSESIKNKIVFLFRSVVLPAEEPDICLIHNLSVASKFTFLGSVYSSAKIAMYFHGGEIPNMPEIMGKKRIFDSMRIIFTNTQFSKSVAVKQGAEEAKIKILPVGFDMDSYEDFPNREYRQSGNFRLLFVGRISEEKGINYLIDAMQHILDKGISNIELRVIGFGPLYEHLKQSVADKCLKSRIAFLGEKSKSEVIVEMKAADCLVLSSIETKTSAETQACVVQEAMLMRTPVITTKIGGVPESICDEMKAFMVPQRDSVALAESIKNVANLTVSEMKSLGESGRRFAEQRYNVVKITGDLIDGCR